MVSGFYKHFCDLIVEGIKGFTISEKELDQRYRFVNPEILNEYFDQGRDVIIAAGHYCNWEWATMQSSRVLKHTCVGIYTPLSNAYFEDKMKASRSKYGLVLVPKDQVKAYFKEGHITPQLYFFLVDQSPSNPDRAFWTSFLGTQTPIQYGVEKYSKEYNLPIFFLTVMRQNRGFYHLTMEKVLDNPIQKEYGQILIEVYSHLENMILQKPEWWLWSHKRWKHNK
jgi:KDO2-lipid IV(A) lauroyltransferase